MRLAEWTSKRRVIFLRRPLRDELLITKRKGKGRRAVQMDMGWVGEGTVLYEHAVLMTNLEEDISTLAHTAGIGATRRTNSKRRRTNGAG